MENPSESIFINRELSWLDFDSRVLALAKEKTVPLQSVSNLPPFSAAIWMSFLWCVLARCMTRRC